MPEQKSAFDTPWFNSQDKNFFNHLNQTKTPNLVLTAETEDFDEELTRQWLEEGFNTVYVPMLKGGNDFVNRVHAAGDGFGAGGYYGIVAYGDAGNAMLEAHIKPNNPRLCAIVAYYPSEIPSINTHFSPGVKVLVHLAGQEIGVRKTPEALGIQGKRKTVRKRIDPGEGYGGSLKLGYQAYTYEGAEPGFAEHDLDEYDPISESVAFTRTLTLLHKAFRLETKVESIRDELVDSTRKGQIDKTNKKLRPYAHVIHGPTLTGGIGSNDISRFYSNFFSPLPQTFSSRLLSRTIGTNRIVDELLVTFTHGSRVEWMLPGIPPTNQKVEIVVVSIVAARGSQLESEHIYWDQASVLVQVGLLDPKVVPENMKKQGVKSVPVVGVEGARAMKRGSSRQINEMIKGWKG